MWKNTPCVISARRPLGCLNEPQLPEKIGVFLSISNCQITKSWFKSYIAAITPGHSHSPQSGESPAKLSINKKWVLPGQMLELKLTTRDNSTFKGFIIQARDFRLKDQQVLSINYDDYLFTLYSTKPSLNMSLWAEHTKTCHCFQAKSLVYLVQFSYFWTLNGGSWG